MNKFGDKIVLVTGAAHGMGRNHVRRFIQEDAYVFFTTDKNVKAGQELARQLGDRARFIRQDVTCEDDWRAVAAEIDNKFGRLDVLVNNAGVMPFGTIGTMGFEKYKRIVAINQFSVFLAHTYCFELLKKSSNASVINVSSAAGFKCIPGGSAYNSSKFAVRALSKVAALEWGSFHIRVNTLCPGGTDTRDGSETYETGFVKSNSVEEMMQKLPLGRMGHMDEMTEMVMFLASDDSSFCTGAEFVADGGYLLT